MRFALLPALVFLSPALLVAGACSDRNLGSTVGGSGSNNTVVSVPSTGGRGSQGGGAATTTLGEGTFSGFLQTDTSTPIAHDRGLSNVSLKEFQPGGASASRLLFVMGASVTCVRCAKETEELTSGLAARLDAKNIRVVQGLLEEADDENLRAWVARYKNNFTTVLDPEKRIALSAQAKTGRNAFVTPVGLVVDPRTLEVLEVLEGTVVASELEQTLVAWATKLDATP